MSPIQEAGLTAVREIRRNLRSTKGIAMFVLFFLGGAVPSVLQVLFLRLANIDSGTDAPEEVRRQVFEQALLKFFSYDQPTAHYLSACPSALFIFLFKGILYVLPLLVLLIGFEQIAGEIQHRSIR